MFKFNRTAKAKEIVAPKFTEYVSTNIGVLPLTSYLELVSKSNGFACYQDMVAAGQTVTVQNSFWMDEHLNKVPAPV